MELQKTNSESPLKTPKIKPDSPLSKRIDFSIKDKDNFDDVFLMQMIMAKKMKLNQF